MNLGQDIERLRSAREFEQVELMCSNALDGLSVFNDQNRLVWAYFTFLKVWALEGQEKYLVALDLLDRLLESASTTSDLDIKELPILRPLKARNPLSPINRSVLEIIRIRLRSRMAQEVRALGDKQVSIPLKLQPSLLYRIQVGDVYFEIQERMKIYLTAFLATEIGLFRPQDFTSKRPHLNWQIAMDRNRFAETPDSGFWGGSVLNSQGKCEFVVPVPNSCHGRPFWIKLWTDEDDQIIVPVIAGSFLLDASISSVKARWNKSLEIVRPIAVTLPSGDQLTFCVLEQSDGGIHGRTWDSAFFLIPHLKNLFESKPSLRIVDLGCGVGTAGLASSLIASSGSVIYLSDLQEALPLAAKNLKMLAEQLPLKSEISVAELRWGDSEALAKFGVQDVIIAADVVYETEYFSDLLKTLLDLSDGSTEIWLVYKRRGLEESEEKQFFDKILQYFSRQIVDIEDTRWSRLGCQLMKLRRRRS
ncbi:hypothetical protein HDU97_001952 [Phlyctochytrium planicorne]|nr:hypothetical protein HDU97_001952 [Phlyctochytrium planicorne]